MGKILVLISCGFLLGCIGDNYEVVKTDHSILRINKSNGEIYRMEGDVLVPILERESKSGTEKKTWDTLTIAGKEKVEVILNTRWRDGKMYFTLFASPYAGRLERAQERLASALTINFYDEYGFKMLDEEVSLVSMIGIVDSDGERKGLRYQSAISVSYDAYQEISNWTATWNF